MRRGMRRHLHNMGRPPTCTMAGRKSSAQPPQQQCYPQTVTQQDNNHTGGTVLGAIVGGVLGSTVGKGDSRKAATVAGAVAGGAIGNRVSAAHDQTYTT